MYVEHTLKVLETAMYMNVQTADYAEVVSGHIYMTTLIVTFNYTYIRYLWLTVLLLSSHYYYAESASRPNDS